jgi:hypothetical protein
VTITVEAMRQLDEDLDRKVEAGEFAEGRGMKNAYTCGSCGKFMIVVLRNPGTTPMWKNCEGCEGEATSRIYRIPQDSPPFYEWYRPMTQAEIIEAKEAEEAGRLGDGEELRRWIESLVTTERITKDRMPYGSPSYSKRRHYKCDARIGV